MLFEQDTVSDERHAVTLGGSIRKSDGERVHRHGPDDLGSRAADNDLGARHVAPETVRVADRHDPDPSRCRSDESPAVARAAAGLERLHQCDGGLPAQSGPQTVGSGIGTEGRDAVERDAAPNGVEMRRRVPEGTGTVRDVPLQPSVGRRGGKEPRQLLLGEDRVGIRGGKVAHEADDARAGRCNLRETPAAHPRIELDVDPRPFRDVVTGDAQLHVRAARLCRLRPRCRAEDDDPGGGQLPTELEPFCEGRHTKRGGTGLESNSADIESTVAIRIGLDDRPELGPIEQADQCAHVVANCTEVDRDE